MFLQKTGTCAGLDMEHVQRIVILNVGNKEIPFEIENAHPPLLLLMSNAEGRSQTVYLILEF